MGQNQAKHGARYASGYNAYPQSYGGYQQGCGQVID